MGGMYLKWLISLAIGVYLMRRHGVLEMLVVALLIYAALSILL